MGTAVILAIMDKEPKDGGKFQGTDSEEAEEIRHNRDHSNKSIDGKRKNGIKIHTTPQEDRKLRVLGEGKGTLTNGHSGRFRHNKGRALPTQIRSDVAQPGKLQLPCGVHRGGRVEGGHADARCFVIRHIVDTSAA